MNEIWKNVKGYEGIYQVNQNGQIKSVARIKSNGARPPKWCEESILVEQTDRGGYAKVLLSGIGKKKTMAVHRIVATAFIPNPNNYPCINHIDENKQNNSVSNLEWCTAKYNNNYGTKRERASKTSSEDVVQFDLNGNVIKIWHGQALAAKTLGIWQGNISMCCRGKLNHTGGFVWKMLKDVNVI